MTIDELLAFWKEPQRDYCRRVLQVSFPDPIEAKEESEPFTIAALDRYAIAYESVAEALRSGSPACLPVTAPRSGAMPPGPLGEFARRDTEREIKKFAHRIRGRHGTQRAQVEIDLGTCMLAGELTDLSDARQFLWRPSTVKDKDLMRGYVLHCVRTVARDYGAQLPAETVVAGTNGMHTFAALDDARGALQDLVDGYFASMTAPPPVPPCAGFAYARKRSETSGNKNSDRDSVLDALYAASDSYHASGDSWRKDSDLPDPCMTTCYGDEDPTERREFKETADRVHCRVVEAAGELKAWE